MKMKDFDHNKHLKENFLDNNRAVIKVLVNDNDGFFDSLDPMKSTINKDIADYIIDKAYNIPFKYKVVIEFYSDKLNDGEKDRIRKLVKETLALKILNMESIIRVNVIKSLCLMLLGALMVLYSFVGKDFFGYIYEEVVYVIGWVLLWEGVDILLLSNNENKVKKKNYKQLYDAEILFSDKLDSKD